MDSSLEPMASGSYWHSWSVTSAGTCSSVAWMDLNTTSDTNSSSWSPTSSYSFHCVTTSGKVSNGIIKSSNHCNSFLYYTTATFNVFRRKHQISNIKLSHFAIWSMTTFAAGVFRPVGPATFVGIMIGLNSVFYYGYLTMTVASGEVRPAGMFRWKVLTKLVHILTVLASCLHQYYFYSLNDDTCGPRPVMAFMAAYKFAVFLALCISLIRTLSLAKVARLKSTSGQFINNNHLPSKIMPSASSLPSSMTQRTTRSTPQRIGG